MNIADIVFPLALSTLALGIVSCADVVPYPQRWRLAEVQPIECHLRFIDQNRKPVSQAVVEANVVTNHPDNTPETTKGLPGLKTDDDGCLDITGESGGRLWLKIADKAYSHGSPTPGFKGGIVLFYTKATDEGNREYGSKDKRAEYVVWRNEGGQSLIKVTGEIRTSYTGSVIRIDLLSGTLVDEGGDIVVNVKMAATDDERRKQADRRGYFPYDCEIVAVAGGFYSFDASADGYENIYGVVGYDLGQSTVRGSAGLGYIDGKPIRFKGLVRTRDGRIYGKMIMSVSVEDVRREQGRVIIQIEDSLFNPSGSRSLEPDPAKLTKLKLTDARKKPDTEPKKQ